ncbi:hypothetical protein AVEN_48372-1 [Araneus ventricosus]|uniref:Uncharacterized protein n=1 Tax=Araneus ventricosus TaxID=182803 RepID=A0A4Y2RXI7_ARAVE|nr:hypothetical protein AVEN_48372-1 [Araneus ventricosus]
MNAKNITLKMHITDACANVTPAMLHRVQREVQARVRMCIVADGEKHSYLSRRYEIEEKQIEEEQMNYTVVEHHRFGTKRHFVDVSA